MLSRYVQHPITGNLFPISSDIGKSILKEYLVNNTELMMGGALHIDPPPPPKEDVIVKEDVIAEDEIAEDLIVRILPTFLTEYESSKEDGKESKESEDRRKFNLNTLAFFRAFIVKYLCEKLNLTLIDTDYNYKVKHEEFFHEPISYTEVRELFKGFDLSVDESNLSYYWYSLIWNNNPSYITELEKRLNKTILPILFNSNYWDDKSGNFIDEISNKLLNNLKDEDINLKTVQTFLKTKIDKLVDKLVIDNTVDTADNVQKNIIHKILSNTEGLVKIDSDEKSNWNFMLDKVKDDELKIKLFTDSAIDNYYFKTFVEEHETYLNKLTGGMFLPPKGSLSPSPTASSVVPESSVSINVDDFEDISDEETKKVSVLKSKEVPVPVDIIATATATANALDAATRNQVLARGTPRSEMPEDRLNRLKTDAKNVLQDAKKKYGTRKRPQTGLIPAPVAITSPVASTEIKILEDRNEKSDPSLVVEPESDPVVGILGESKENPVNRIDDKSMPVVSTFTTDGVSTSPDVRTPTTDGVSTSSVSTSTTDGVITSPDVRTPTAVKGSKLQSVRTLMNDTLEKYPSDKSTLPVVSTTPTTDDTPVVSTPVVSTTPTTDDAPVVRSTSPVGNMKISTKKSMTPDVLKIVEHHAYPEMSREKVRDALIKLYKTENKSIINLSNILKNQAKLEKLIPSLMNRWEKNNPRLYNPLRKGNVIKALIDGEWTKAEIHRIVNNDETVDSKFTEPGETKEYKNPVLELYLAETGEFIKIESTHSEIKSGKEIFYYPDVHYLGWSKLLERERLDLTNAKLKTKKVKTDKEREEPDQNKILLEKQKQELEKYKLDLKKQQEKKRNEEQRDNRPFNRSDMMRMKMEMDMDKLRENNKLQLRRIEERERREENARRERIAIDERNRANREEDRKYKQREAKRERKYREQREEAQRQARLEERKYKERREDEARRFAVAERKRKEIASAPKQDEAKPLNILDKIIKGIRGEPKKQEEKPEVVQPPVPPKPEQPDVKPPMPPVKPEVVEKKELPVPIQEERLVPKMGAPQKVKRVLKPLVQGLKGDIFPLVREGDEKLPPLELPGQLPRIKPPVIPMKKPDNISNIGKEITDYAPVKPDVERAVVVDDKPLPLNKMVLPEKRKEVVRDVVDKNMLPIKMAVLPPEPVINIAKPVDKNELSKRDLMIIRGMYMLNKDIVRVKNELDDMKMYRDNVAMKKSIMKQVKSIGKKMKRKKGCCSLCGSKGTNSTNCPLNPKATQAQNPYSKKYTGGKPKLLPNGQHSTCPGNPDTHKNAVKWSKRAGDFVPRTRMIVVPGAKNMPACEKMKMNKPLLKRQVVEAVQEKQEGGSDIDSNSDDDSLIELSKSVNFLSTNNKMLGGYFNTGNDLDSILKLADETGLLNETEQLGGGTDDLDSVLELAGETGLLNETEQLGGGADDLDSVLELAGETGLLNETEQLGGGADDLDSVLELAGETDLLNETEQLGGGADDLDSVLDMANRAGLI